MRRFNLLTDAWIQVKGRVKPITVSKIVQPDILALDAPRADFNAALMQFLIGILQTVFAPKNPREWRKYFATPPDESEFQEKLDEIKPAFYLDGDGYRFMQDTLAKKVGKKKPIEEMIFGAPGESGKEKNQDHFIKQSDISRICLPCCSSGILAANFFAEDGGQSYFPGMRGNGFISNLVCIDERQSDASIWKNIWLNVLENSELHIKDEIIKNFFWCQDFPDKLAIENLEKLNQDCKDLKISKKATKVKEEKDRVDNKIKEIEAKTKSIKASMKTQVVFPDTNDIQVYWAWSRRYWIEVVDGVGRCDLCGQESEKLIEYFFKTNKGYKYPKEHWQNKHPLSPSQKFERTQYNKNNEKYRDKMLALEMTANGLPYTYWQNFIIQTEKQAPARVVSKYIRAQSTEDKLIIWSFGYAMDSNSPLAWYESKTPLDFVKDESCRKLIEAEIQRYVQASVKISDSRNGYLTNAIKSAWFDEDEDKNKGQKKSFIGNKSIEIGKCFLNQTHDKFYQCIGQLYNQAKSLDDDTQIKLRTDWYRHIKEVTEHGFNQWAFKASIKTNPKRIAIAHKQLMQNMNSKSLMQDTLGLPKEK